MATWTPIAGTLPQYQKADGTLASAYYLKFYVAGTTTPLSMATDSTGATTLAKCQINSSGYPINGSSDPFIPHISQSYKIVLYKNSTDADNDTTANADWVLDNLSQIASSSPTQVIQIEYQAGSDASGQVFTLADFTYTAGVNNLLVYQNGVLLRQGVSYDYEETSSSSITVNSSITINPGDSWAFVKGSSTTSTISDSSSVTFTPSFGDATNVQAFLRATSMWVPSDPTGATNMASELEDFIEANAGKRVVVSAGSTILLENFGTNFTAIPTVIDIDGNGCKVLYNNDSPAIFINNTSNASSEVSVSSMSDTYIHSTGATTAITLSSTLSAEVLDWIAVYSEDTVTGMNVKAGEIAQVIQDESSLVVNTVGRLGLTSEFSTTIKARLLDRTRSLKIENFIFESNGDAEDITITTREECIFIAGYVDPILNNNTFIAPWAICQWFQCCAQPKATNYKIRDTGNLGNYNGYTYGAYVYGMNYGAHFSGAELRNGRHLGATTGGNESGSSTWWQYGYPTRYVFENMVSHNSFAVPFDSHEQGVDGIWRNCTAIVTTIDRATGGVNGKGFNSRAFRETFEGMIVEGSSDGGQIADIDHGKLNTVILRNITIRNTYNSGNNGTALILENRTAADELRVEIDNLKINDCDRGIEVGANVQLVFNDIAIHGADDCFLVRAGADIVGKGLLMDYSKSIHATLSKCFNIYSATADTYIRLLDSPVVIMKATNLPRELFSEADATGTKYVYHPGMTVVNNFDGGGPYTDTLSKKSGSTTFTDLTDVSTVAL